MEIIRDGGDSYNCNGVRYCCGMDDSPMKKDINFIKHIKPQLKERERVDKAFSRDRRADKAFRSIGIDPHKEGIGVEEIGIFNAIIRRFKG
jgi:hypothetical protein